MLNSLRAFNRILLRNRLILILWVLLFFISCEKQQTIKPLNHQQLLVQALVKNNFSDVNHQKTFVRLTENTQNIIDLYIELYKKNIITFRNKLEYTQQFSQQMGFVHQSMLFEMQKWFNLKYIYQQEVSPPVRILQREKLYLAPSKINFGLCPSANSNCAGQERKKLSTIMTNEEIIIELKKMARKDPCVNMSKTLKDDYYANRCLRKSKGNLQIELLDLPQFNYNEWLQVIAHE